MSLAGELIHEAVSRKITVSVAESCTGGMLAAEITSQAGASAIFEQGFVTYSNRAKMAALGVSVDTLNAHGAVSEEVALEMAQGARAAASASLAVSITGIAGPGGSEHKPEGMVCFGVASALGAFTLTSQFGPLGRDKVRSASMRAALQLLIDEVRKL